MSRTSQAVKRLRKLCGLETGRAQEPNAQQSAGPEREACASAPAAMERLEPRVLLSAMPFTPPELHGRSAPQGDVVVALESLGSAPGVPSGVSATDGTALDKVTVSWAAAQGATGYEVWRNPSNNSATAAKLNTLDVVGTTYDDTTAAAGTQYYYWVKAKNTDGTTGFSAVDAGYRGLTAPTNVAATDGTSLAKVTVSWTASTGATAYEVWRGTTNNPASAVRLKSSVAGTSYDDNAATAGTQYYYWVKAKNTLTTSGFSASNAGNRLAVPTGLAASDGTYLTKVTVSWTASIGATGYEVWRNTANSSATATKITAQDVAGVSYDDTTAAAGTQYYYWVKAKNGDAVTGFSNGDAGMILTAATGLAASDGTALDKVSLTWTASAGATGYEVWRYSTSLSSAATKISVSDVVGTSYNDTTAAPGTRYYYWVKAKNASGTTGFSNIDCGYRQIAAPTNVAASDGTHLDGVSITWTASAGASAYEVWRGPTSDVTLAVKVSNADIATTSFADPTTVANTQYYYWVKAKSDIATSAMSAADQGSVLSSPTGVSATDGTALDKVTVSWTASPGATAYEVWRSASNNSATATKLNSQDVVGTTYDDTTATVGTQYYYWAQAKNADGVTALSAGDAGYRGLTAPTNVAATDGTLLAKVTVSWTASSGATAYEVWRSTTNSSATAVKLSGSVAGVSYDDTTAAVGTTYYYFIKAKNSLTTSGFSTGNAGNRLAAPLGVTAGDGTALDKVTVSWATSAGAAGYEVWRNSTNGTATAAKLNSQDVVGTTYDDTTAAPGVQYYYWVKAKNTDGTTGFSAVDAGYRGLTAPANVAATDGTSLTKVTVTWAASTGATAYEVWRNTTNNSGTAVKIKASTTSTSYDDSTAVAGTGYYYFVKAKNSLTTSAFSTGNAGNSLAAPTAVTAGDGTALDKVTVSWTAAIGAAGYEVWRNTANSSATATKITTQDVVGVSYDDATATPGTPYYYWVKAKNGAITAGFSNGDAGYRQLTAPTNVAATDGTLLTKVTVTWTASTGAATYDVYRGATNVAANATLLAAGTGLTVTTFDDTTAASGSTYYYFVKAKTPTATSAFSSGDAGLVLSAPTGVTAGDGTALDKVAVSWTAATGAAGYEVWRNWTNDSSTATKISAQDVAGVSYDDATATPGTQYYYWVKAKNASGTTGFSSGDAGYRQLAAPTNVAATEGTLLTKVTVTWTASTGAATYDVYRGATNVAADATLLAAGTGLTVTTFDDTTAASGSTYYYFVKAKTPTATSAFSAGDSGLVLAPPTGVLATDATYTTKVVVSWTAATGASAYEVWRSQTNNSTTASKISAQDVAGVNYDDTTAAQSTVYFYWVKAKNASGTTDFSASDAGFAAGD